MTSCFACARHSPIRTFPTSSIWRPMHTSHHFFTAVRPLSRDIFLFTVTRLTLHPTRNVRRRCRLDFLLSIHVKLGAAQMRPWREPVQGLCIYYIYLYSHYSATALEALPTPLSPTRSSLTLPSAHTGLWAILASELCSKLAGLQRFLLCGHPRTRQRQPSSGAVHALRKNKRTLGTKYTTITSPSPSWAHRGNV